MVIHTKRFRLLVLFEFLGVCTGLLGLGGLFIGSLAATGIHSYLLLSSCIILIFTALVRVLYFLPEQKGRLYRSIVIAGASPLVIIAILEITIPAWAPFAYKQKWISYPRIAMPEFIPVALGGIIILALIFLSWKKYSGHLVALSYLISIFAMPIIEYIVLLFCFIGLCLLTFNTIRDAFELRRLSKSQDMRQLA